MASNYPPKSWLETHSALSSRGMEVTVPPGQEPPSPNQYRGSGSGSPIGMKSDERYRTWNRVANTISAQREEMERERERSGWSTSVSESEQVSPRSSGFVNLNEGGGGGGLQPRPSASPRSMSTRSTSSRKVLQLTGHDVGFEKAFPKRYQQNASSQGSDSEGSVYSQPEFSVSSNIGSYTSADSASVDVNTRRSEAQQRAHTISKLQQNVAPSAEDIITLQEILTEQQRRYEEELLREGKLVPHPLAIRTKKKRSSLLSPRPSILKNARDSFEWGLNELTAPRLRKPEKTPRKARFSMHSGNTTEEEMPPTPPPKSPRRKKKSFATGDHPLKSPYPFPRKEEDDTITSPSSESKFGSKISGAIKSLSNGRRGSQTNKIVITNKARKNSGPDTPVVGNGKSSFVETMHKGNEQLQDIIEKTKKSVLRTAEEKRRDELKKKIVVVGIGDQSPDGRVSEWL